MKSQSCSQIGYHLVKQLKSAMTEIDKLEPELSNPDCHDLIKTAHASLREQIRNTITTIELLQAEKPFSHMDFPEFTKILGEFKKTHGWFGYL